MKQNSITTVYNDTSTGNLVVCLNNDITIGSFGMWIGNNPLDFVIPITLCQVIILVLLSKLLHYILRTIHTPKFICSVIVSFLSLSLFIILFFAKF